MTGQFAEGASPTAALHKGMAILLSVPVAGFAAIMMFIGLRSMADPKQWGDLGVCFWAGFAILAAWVLLLVHFLWRVPQRTISSFELADGNFTCTTPRDGTRTYPVATLKGVTVVAGKRKILGWVICFADSKPLQVSAEMPNVDQLVAELNSQR